jgi:purine catabolism regulator
VTVPRRTGYDQASGWLVAAVGAHGVDWGRLIVVLSGPPRPADTVLVERAATTLALASLVRDRPDQGPERIAHRSVLAALAGTEYADPFDLQARITALGVPLAGHALIPLVICPDARARSAAEVADLLSAACRELGVPAITGVLGEQRAAALLSVPPGFDQDDVLTRLAARLRGDSGESGPVIGVGPMVASLAEAASALRDATAAAGAAERYGSDRPFVRLADLRLAGLLYQLRDDPRLLAFAERELGPLLVHDERAGTRLVQVLASYLEAGGNKAETAQRAGLARPTLYERLREIEQILGIPLDDAASRLALHAALLVERASRRTPSA